MQRLFAFCVLALLFSCKKDADILSIVNFSGSVKDSTTLGGIANVRIRMYWYNQDNYKETYVDSTITDAQGNYTIKATIDKSKFKTHLLNVTAVVPNAYISPVDIENSETGESIGGIQSDKLELIDLYLYRKAFLAISLKKTSNDSLSELELHYGYQGPNSRNYWIINKNSPVPTGDSTLSVITAVGMSTKVYWSKKTSTGAILNFKDSITCLPGINNIITLNY